MRHIGLGIGPKSATVPIYAAECSPPQIRGALVMQWQMVSIQYYFTFLFFSLSSFCLSHHTNSIVVDRFWYICWLRLRSYFLSRARSIRNHWLELEIDDGIRLSSCYNRRLLRIPMP
jgi:hypothetical protein